VTTVLLVGKDLSDLRALSELVYLVCAQIRRGPTTVLTASAEDTVLDILSRNRIDILIATYANADLGYDLIRWLHQGQFGVKMLLVTADGDRLPTRTDLRAHGVDAIIGRPVTEQKLKKVCHDWFR
jgi:response regulator of citrate/malate metabolism